MRNSSTDQVRHRRVFYIPGFDPFPPRRYRELYRKESAQQAEISGYDIAVRPRQTEAGFGWSVDAVINETQVRSDIDVLIWSDIVRANMKPTIPATYLHLWRTAATYLRSGALFRLMRLRKGPVIAALYPVAMLLGQAMVACIAAALVIWLGTGLTVQEVGTTGMILTLFAALSVFWAVLWWFRQHDNRFFAYYLLHDYAFSAAYGGAYPPELAARLSEFADRIGQALSEEADEVLIVGHSSGAHLGVSVLAELLRRGTMRADGPALSLLTLGQVVPMVSFLPDADQLRADLRYLSARDDLAWVDVSAPGDGCAFALCDPVAVSGVAPPDQKGPLVFSAAFSQSLSPARLKALRWRFFRLHFQYLCAFDRPKDYDYFQITAGPLTLGARYAGRVASRSRITRPVNRHTSVTV